MDYKKVKTENTAVTRKVRQFDAETGNYIQQQINLLEFIKMEMSDVAGIAR